MGQAFRDNTLINVETRALFQVTMSNASKETQDTLTPGALQALCSRRGGRKLLPALGACPGQDSVAGILVPIELK